MIIRNSHAKVNLYLKVLNKRTDGYHDIASLMQKIDLADEMEFRAAGTGIRLSCPGSGLPEDSRNLVHRAARAILDAAGEKRGIEIVLRKKIPTGAGLGGGSSNAATTLAAINEVLKLGFSREDLIGMGSKIGADVPFFIYGGRAWAFGIGEVLKPAGDIPDMSFLLVNPGFEVSTKTVYEGLNLSVNFGLTKGPTTFNIPVFNRSGGLKDIAGMLHNDLEAVTLNLHPQLKEIKKELLRCGALASLMSGSGPTVFGVFEDEEGASRAAAELKMESGWSVFTARSLE